MTKKEDLDFEVLTDAIKERGKRILERFGQVVVSGVSDPELLLILDEIKNGWRDAFRPTLTSLACEAVGGQLEIAEEAGLMFTLAGAGIGIHDDILDQCPKKHFRKTILGLHGPDAALLVGDLLIVKAWTIIHEMIRKNRQPLKIADVVEVYGRLSVEICEAEFLETKHRHNLDLDLEENEKILWKAMAETEACTRIGAILGNGSEKEVQSLAEFGRRLGFINRLADDVKDCLNVEGDLPQRIEHESVPLPLLFAAKSSEAKYCRIKAIIEKVPLSALETRELLEICFETEAFAYVRGIAKFNEKEAIKKLRSLKPSEAQNVLIMITRKSFTDLSDFCL